MDTNGHEFGRRGSGTELLCFGSGTARIWSAAVSKTSRSTPVIRSCCDWLSAQSRSGLTVARAISTLVAFGVLAVHAEKAAQSSTNAPITNPLVWDAMEKFARMTAMNQTTNFTFWVTNTSFTDTLITHTESSCDCTVAKLPSQPWVLRPGESGSLGVKMNLMGRHGRVSKEVWVGTSHGPQILRVHADIPLAPAPFNVSARQQDVLAARKDRQVVFEGRCAACHALPAAGRQGKDLFNKACAICHISRHRADFVPDLALLKRPTDAEYWRTWITHGKEGTLMPAFANSERGILDTHQIESLVEYLVEAYPAKTTSATNATSTASALP